MDNEAFMRDLMRLVEIEAVDDGEGSIRMGLKLSEEEPEDARQYITGLPATLPDGTRIVGWDLKTPNEDDIWYHLGRGWQEHVSAYERLVAITGESGE